MAVPQAPDLSGYRPTGNQAGLRARSKDWQTIPHSGELPDPFGALSAMTESPKGASIFKLLL